MSTAGAPDWSPARQAHIGRTVSVLSLCAFSSGTSMRVCDPLLPKLAIAFGVTLPVAAATITSFGIAYGFAQLLFGPLGDRLGKLRVIRGSTLAAAVCAAACALAPDLHVLVIARAVNGVFAAAVIPLAMAWIGDQVPFERRQPVLATYLIGQMLGVSAGQLIGGVVADLVGWRGAFWASASIFAAGGSMLSWLLYRRSQPDALVEQAGAMATPGSPPPGFVRSFVSVLRQRWALAVYVIVFVEGALIFGAIAMVASHLQRDYGLSASMAGLASGCFGLGGIGYSLNAGPLLRRLDSTGLVIAGGFGFTLAMLVLGSGAPWWVAIVASTAAGTGYYMLHNTLQNQATQLSTHARGAAIALFAGAFWMGQAIGVWLAARTAERLGFESVFLACGLGIGLLGVLVALAIRHRRRNAAA